MISKIFSPKYLLVVFLFLVAANLIYLDNELLKNLKTPEKKSDSKIEKSTIVVPEGLDEDCPKACLSKIDQATSSIKLTQSSSLEKSTTQSQSSSAGSSSTVKEFFVSFGSGSSSAEDWTDISGLAAYIDSTKYGKIQTVVFEATLRIPTGNQIAWARLFNATDKHPVWFSEVSIEGGTPKLLISNPITLDSGNKLYQVQIKTQLKSPAILDQARVHVTTY